MPIFLMLAAAASFTTSDQDTISQIDTQYQLAVRRGDADAMAKILHPQFELVLGTGQRISRGMLLDVTRRKEINYIVQDEEPGTQHVMVSGDTAIVTAKLILKGTVTKTGKPIDRVLWFSDTYVHTREGWRYLFGQASLPLNQQ